MSKLILSSLIGLTAMFASASGHATVQASRADEKAKWTCSASGKQSFGGPVGDIWQTVYGRGRTEQDAWSDAHTNCISQGLQMCMVQHCWK